MTLALGKNLIYCTCDFFPQPAATKIEKNFPPTPKSNHIVHHAIDIPIYTFQFILCLYVINMLTKCHPKKGGFGKLP